jgi:hypothetical protein
MQQLPRGMEGVYVSWSDGGCTDTWIDTDGYWQLAINVEYNYNKVLHCHPSNRSNGRHSRSSRNNSFQCRPNRSHHRSRTPQWQQLQLPSQQPQQQPQPQQEQRQPAQPRQPPQPHLLIQQRQPHQPPPPPCCSWLTRQTPAAQSLSPLSASQQHPTLPNPVCQHSTQPQHSQQRPAAPINRVHLPSGLQSPHTPV